MSRSIFDNFDIEVRSDKESTGGRIRRLRKSLNLSQAELAEKVGTTHATIARYESNKHKPNGMALHKLASALGTSESYLLCLTDDDSRDCIVSRSHISVDLDISTGCEGCKFIDMYEWEMPCAKCKRNAKDYWMTNNKDK